MEDILNRLKERLGTELPHEEFRRWIAPINFQGMDENIFSIQVPNIFFKIWIEEKYLSKMKLILADLRGKTVSVNLVMNPTAQDVLVSEDSKDQIPGVSKDRLPPAPAVRESTLVEKYCFDNFVVGSSNQLAHAASLAVANRSAAYNPLFIYGGSGLGKTHLLNAIGNHVLTLEPTLKVVYLSSEEFTNELIEAIRTEGMAAFRQKYRNIGMLLIDDIHFIGGRERTQEEFFYTFNALYETDKHIVLSSDKMPKEIPDLEDRLRSRFEGGLFADISPPDRETKVAILYKKAEEEGVDLTYDVAFYLASQNETNIRILEGYLSRLAAYASLTQKRIDLELAQKLLGRFIEDDRKQITLDTIMKVTADFFNIRVSDLKSAKKQKVIAAPRQAAMFMARQLTSLSTIDIGQRFGGRDHSTVIHAVKKVENLIQTDHNFARTINELKRTIRNNAV